MSPSAPKQITWIIGLVLGIAGIIGHYMHVEFLTEHNFLLLLIGYVVLVLGTSMKGV
jgi:hypothetical protein